VSSIRALESSSAAQRIAAAADFVCAYPPGTEILLLGPTREAIDDFVRGLSAEHGATFGLHRLTLTQLAARLAEPTFAVEGVAPCTPLASEALVTRASFETLARGELSYFEPVARFPGFPRALAATSAELRNAGIEARTLDTQSQPAPELGNVLRELDRRMNEAALADRAALFTTATRAVRDGHTSAYVGLPVLLLDVPLESNVECDLVKALAARAPALLATIPTGDDGSISAFGGFANVESLESQETGTECGLTRLRRYLFAAEAPPKGTEEDQVRFFSAPGEGREAVEVARYLLDELRSGVRLDEMAVFVRIPETYTPLLQTAFRRTGIPAYFARGTKRADPSGRAFLALLACGAEDLSARRFAEYLAFGQTPPIDVRGVPRAGEQTWVGAAEEFFGTVGVAVEVGSEEESVDDSSQRSAGEPDTTLRAPWKWEELLVEAAVIGSVDRWRRRLDGLRAELEQRREEVLADDGESSRSVGIERKIANLDHLRSLALPVIEELASFPATATWGDWIARLTDLAPRVLRRPERVLRLLAELQPMAVVDAVSIDEVRETLSERLSFLEEDPPARRYGRVFVATPEQARGRTFKVVFILGLAERIFPQRPREDPLLLDALRRQVSDRLATQEARGQRERLLLRLAVGAAEQRLYLSYPRVDVIQARPRVTSFYGLDLSRAVHGAIPDPERFERETASAASARLAWPAPADPARAIDAGEHDLSVLDRLIHETDSEASAGRARYLLELNPHLARSLRTRYARWETRAWSKLDGLVRKTAATEAALTASRLNHRPYSPSALEKFAVCPYRFFLSAMHRLESREEAVALEQLDPLTRGKLFHRVQAETLRSLKASGSLPLNDTDLAGAQAVLSRTLAEVDEQYREKFAPPIARVWQDEIALMRADLLSWLRRLFETSKTWQPEYFELGFGLPADPERDPDSITEPSVLDDGTMLRGAVDLIERSADGTQLRVTDHKTGVDRTAPDVVIGGGETLQPVLYGLAVEKALKMSVAEARLSFCTSRGGFSERVVTLNDRARAQGREVLGVIDRAIESGFLPQAPREKACEHCDFRVVCGPWEEERVTRKDPKPLADLRALRQRP
jgi:CRISPR/Cas system-associated exonuclease Cas4 (RecB family)